MSNTILQQIDECKQIFPDLELVTEEILEGDPSKDQLANMIIGISQMHKCRLDKLERLIKQK